MKKLKYLFLILILLLVGCESNSKIKLINAVDSEEFYYTLNLEVRDDLKTNKSNGEFLFLEILIEPRNNKRYKEINIEPSLKENLKLLLVEGIYDNFKTNDSNIILDEFSNYNGVSLAKIFSVSSKEDIEEIKNILTNEGLEVLITWKDGQERALVKYK